MPYARDFQNDATAARKIEGVILVVFVADHCPYCETVLNEFLIPMSGNADYQAKLVMRRVELSGDRTLRDFTGKRVGHRAFAGRHGIRLTPTVMLFSPEGEPLAKPLIGLSTIDYYGYFLDQAIDEAVAKVRGTPAP